MYVIPKMLLVLVLTSVAALLFLSVTQMVALDIGLRNFSDGIVNGSTVTRKETEGESKGEGFTSFSDQTEQSDTRGDYETCSLENGYWRHDDKRLQSALQPYSGSERQFEDVSELCGSIGRSLNNLTRFGGTVRGRFLTVALQQGLFVALAAMVVAVALSVTLALAISLDWLQNSLGYGSLSRTILRVIDAIPYTVWLLLLIGFHLSVAGFLTGLLHDSRWERSLTALLSQSIIYAGVFLLLMPLFLSLFVAAIRRARNDGIFDAFVMDGMYMREIYWKILRHRLLAPAGKAFLFALAFVVMFDPLLQRITEGRLAVYAAVLNGPVPKQVFLSSFYQWSRLKEHRILAGEEARAVELELTQISVSGSEAVSPTPGKYEIAMEDRKKLEKSLWREIKSSLILPAAKTVAIMPMLVDGGAHKVIEPTGQLAIQQMWVYPGLRLDVTLWRSIQRNPGLCNQLRVCRTLTHNGRLPAFLIQGSIVQAFSKAYFFLNLAIILFLVGPLAALALQRFSSGRVERA